SFPLTAAAPWSRILIHRRGGTTSKNLPSPQTSSRTSLSSYEPRPCSCVPSLSRSGAHARLASRMRRSIDKDGGRTIARCADHSHHISIPGAIAVWSPSCSIAEWPIDNFHIVNEQLYEIRAGLLLLQ